MTKQDRRLLRQFNALQTQFPLLKRPIRTIMSDGWGMFRIPLAITLIILSFFSFLPMLGLWMLPVGLLVLARDFEPLQGPVSGVVIRVRRRLGPWMRKGRKKQNNRL